MDTVALVGVTEELYGLKKDPNESRHGQYTWTLRTDSTHRADIESMRARSSEAIERDATVRRLRAHRRATRLHRLSPHTTQIDHFRLTFSGIR